jgi:CRP-like cAMP-binding protein
VRKTTCEPGPLADSNMEATMINLDMLEKVEVFKDLNDKELTAVRPCCERVAFQRGEKIFGPGEDPSALWAVLEGHVDLGVETTDGKNAGDLGSTGVSENMVFGWSSFVPPHRYMLSAYCVSRRCDLIKSDKACLSELFEKYPEIGYKVMLKLLSVIGRRFNQYQEILIERRGQEIMNRW